MLTSTTRGEMLTPDPNECNSTLTSGTNNIYPYPYIDVNDRGHRLRIAHTRSTGKSTFKFRVMDVKGRLNSLGLESF